MFSSVFCKIFKNTFFIEHQRILYTNRTPILHFIAKLNICHVSIKNDNKYSQNSIDFLHTTSYNSKYESKLLTTVL